MEMKWNNKDVNVPSTKQKLLGMTMGFALGSMVFGGGYLWATDQKLAITVSVKPRYIDTSMPEFEDVPAVKQVCTFVPGRVEPHSGGVFAPHGGDRKSDCSTPRTTGERP
jgi:hypothetical protein